MNSYDEDSYASGYTNESYHHHHGILNQEEKAQRSAQEVRESTRTINDNLRITADHKDHIYKNASKKDEVKVEPYHYVQRIHSMRSFDQMPLNQLRGDLYCSPPSVISELSDHTSQYNVLSVSSLRSEEQCNDVELHATRREEVSRNDDAPVFERHHVEVGNDILQMAGVDETSYAHGIGDTIDIDCIQCKTVLFCKQSASMVICPVCRCVSPIEVTTSNAKPVPKSELHVGIGLTIDFVLAMQG